MVLGGRPLRIVVPILATIAAMASFQAGAALAKGLFPLIGPQGAGALRFALGAAMLTAIVRPWRAWPRGAAIWPVVTLGVAMSMTTLMFYGALARLPQGVVVSLQFLGPLAVAILGSRRPADLLWAVLAGTGVWLLVGAGQAAVALDPIGILLALGAAAGWATYILLGRVVSAASGISATPLMFGIAAVILLPVGAQHAGAALISPAMIPAALAMALFAAALPFVLEFYAMPRMPARTFAVFMSLEPAFGVLAGLVILGERLALAQTAGVAAVIVAAAGAAWSGADSHAHPAVTDGPPT